MKYSIHELLLLANYFSIQIFFFPPTTTLNPKAFELFSEFFDLATLATIHWFFLWQIFTILQKKKLNKKEICL